MPVIRPQLSPQLSPPQMRPPSRQPPALPRGRPQDQLGNAAGCRSYAMLPALGLPLSSALGVASGWMPGPLGLTHPSAQPACWVSSFSVGRLAPSFSSSPERPCEGRQHLCGGGPLGTCQEPLPGPGAGDRQPFEKIPGWEAGFESWPGLSSLVTPSLASERLPCYAGKLRGAEGSLYMEGTRLGGRRTLALPA